MLAHESRTADALRAVGRKVTPQRLAVGQVLAAASAPLTMPQILDAAKTLAPFIDGSTVSRTLRVFEELRLIEERRSDDGFVYVWLPDRADS